MKNFVEENCVFAGHQAGGAYVAGDRALVFIGHNGLNGYNVTDWHGNILGKVLHHVVGATRHTPNGGHYRMAYVKVEMGGWTWVGRYSFDNVQAVRLRKEK